MDDPLVGQIGAVQALAFSRDTRILAVVSGSSRPLVLWDISHPTRPLKLAQPVRKVRMAATSAAFSADSRILAIGEHDSGALVWDVRDVHNPHLVAGPLDGTATHDVAFSPTGNPRLFTFNSVPGETTWWNVEDLTHIHKVLDPFNILVGMSGSVIAFSPDGHIMARADAQGTSIDLWVRRGPGQPTAFGTPLIGHRGPVLTVRFTPNGAMLATGGADGTVVLWDVRDRSHPARLGPALSGRSQGVRALAFTPNGRVLAVGSAGTDGWDSGEGSVALWDVSDPAHPRRIAEPLTGLGSTGAFALAFSADGALLIVDATPPILLDVRDPAAPRRVAALPGEQIVDIHTTKGGRTIAVLLGAQPGVTDPGTSSGVRLWDVTDPHALHQIGTALVGHSSSVYYAALSAHGDRLVTGDHLLSVQNHPTAIVWDLHDLEHPLQQGPPLDPTSFGYFDVALDPEGRLLAIGGALGIATLWTLDDRSRARPLAQAINGPGGRINDLTFASDGTTLALAGGDGQVALWDLQPVHDLRAHGLRDACEITSGGLDHVEWRRYLPNRQYEATCVHA